MSDLDEASADPGDRMTFLVPDEVPNRHTTAQLPPDEQAAGDICLRLFDPHGTLVVHEHRWPVSSEGILDLPLPDNAAPGRWTLMRGPLIRSMILLPLRSA